MKLCSKCEKFKPKSEFYRSGQKRGGVRAECKECSDAMTLRWQRKNRAAYNAQRVAYDKAHIPQTLIRAARARAKQRGLRFNLTVKDILPLPKTCPVLGLPLTVGIGRWKPVSYTIDRVDNSQGYIRGNVIVVSRRANTLKGDASLAEMMALADFYGRLKGHDF